MCCWAIAIPLKFYANKMNDMRMCAVKSMWKDTFQGLQPLNIWLVDILLSFPLLCPLTCGRNRHWYQISTRSALSIVTPNNEFRLGFLWILGLPFTNKICPPSVCARACVRAQCTAFGLASCHKCIRVYSCLVHSDSRFTMTDQNKAVIQDK